MAERYRTREFTPRPPKVETASERGQALKNWFDVQEISVAAFAEASGIGRATLNKFFSGDKDLAKAQHETASAIMTALDISDTQVWEVLGIPEESRKAWRTFRPYPLGHGMPEDQIPTIAWELVDSPMFGDASAPTGAVVLIDPEGDKRKYQVIKLADGRLYCVLRETLAHIVDKYSAEHLGGVVQIQLP